jgi:hypothetical protein
MIISQARSLWVTLQLQTSQVITTYHYKKQKWNRSIFKIRKDRIRVFCFIYIPHQTLNSRPEPDRIKYMTWHFLSFSFRSPNHTFLFIPVQLPVISTNILLQHYNKLQKEITFTCCMVCKQKHTIYKQWRSWLSWLIMYAVLTLTYKLWNCTNL